MHTLVRGGLKPAPGATVTLSSGCGDATAMERILCTADPEIRDNDGEIVGPYDDLGGLRARPDG